MLFYKVFIDCSKSNLNSCSVLDGDLVRQANGFQVPVIVTKNSVLYPLLFTFFVESFVFVLYSHEMSVCIFGVNDYFIKF